MHSLWELRLAGSVMPSYRYPAVARRKKARCQLVILPYVDMYFVFYANTFLSRYRCVFRRIAQGDVAGHDIVFRMPDNLFDVFGFLRHRNTGYAQYPFGSGGDEYVFNAAPD